MNKIGQVLSSAPDTIVVEVTCLQIFEENKADLQVGDFLKIAQGNNDFAIAVIKNLKGVNSQGGDKGIQCTFTI